MTTKEEAERIALEYSEKLGFTGISIIESKDKIYKWLVVCKNAAGQFHIEIAKADNIVLKFEKI